MDGLFYLLKVSACMTLFYIFYHLFLRRLTFFSFNRVYLLVTLLISFLLPVLRLEVKRMIPVAKKDNLEVFGSSFNQKGSLDMPGQTSSYYDDAYSFVTGIPSFRNDDLERLMSAGYWLIVTGILLMFLFRMYFLLKHLSAPMKKIGHLNVIYKPGGFTNCSFFTYVFVDKENLDDPEILALLQHESVHAARYHSLDKLLLVVCKTFLWFNPFVYLYDSALERVHEYEADEETSMKIGQVFYASLLLQMATKESNGSLVHSFAENPVKERIKMLFTNPSNHMKKLLYATCIPLLGILLLSFSVKEIDHSGKPSLKTNVPKHSLVNRLLTKADSVKMNDTLHKLTKPTVSIAVAKKIETGKSAVKPEREAEFIEMGTQNLPIIEKVEYSARDSTKVNRKMGYVHLFGKATLAYKDLRIVADELKYYAHTGSLIAKNAIITNVKDGTHARSAAYCSFILKENTKKTLDTMVGF